MAKANDITIRVKIGGYELEVSGPKKWAETQVEKFIARVKKENQRSNPQARTDA